MENPDPVAAMDGSNHQQQQGACAACKHQRKKCGSDCVMAPFFPQSKTEAFNAVHKVFGVSNVQKLLRSRQSQEEKQFMAETLVWEAVCRNDDPVYGCYREVEDLRNKVAYLSAKLEELTNQNALLLPPPAATGVVVNKSDTSIGSIPSNNSNHIMAIIDPGNVNYFQEQEGNHPLGVVFPGMIDEMAAHNPGYQFANPIVMRNPIHGYGVNHQYLMQGREATANYRSMNVGDGAVAPQNTTNVFNQQQQQQPMQVNSNCRNLAYESKYRWE